MCPRLYSSSCSQAKVDLHGTRANSGFGFEKSIVLYRDVYREQFHIGLISSVIEVVSAPVTRLRLPASVESA